MELIVHNKEDFNTLKQFASYSSELTGVLEIPDFRINDVKVKYEELLNKYCDIDTFPEVLIDTRPKIIAIKDKLYIENVDSELSTYLDLPINGEIKLNTFVKVLELVEMFNIDETAKSFFTKISEDDSITKLYSSNFSTNYKHKRWSLAKNLEKISDLKINEREISEKSFKVYRNLKIERVEGNSVFCENNFELRFFFLSFQQKSVFHKGQILNAMCDKTYGGRNKKILISPEIVPSSFLDKFEKIEVKANKRDIPIKLLKPAIIEYIVRNR